MKLSLLLAAGASALLLGACSFSGSSSYADEASGLDYSKPLTAFDSVALKGGGALTIKHGDTYRFENTGSPDAWKVKIKSESLELSCKKPCKNKKLTGIVTLPVLSNLALMGGGDIDVEGNFKTISELNIALMGGGDIDTMAAPADEVNVSLQGGGDIKVAANDLLNVSIMGGGDIKYRGNPKVNTSIMGGGDVRKVK